LAESIPPVPAETVSRRDSDEVRWSRAMAAAHGGDIHLYEQLLRELGHVTERYIQRRFGRLACVEDCVQECLLAVHLARHTWDPRRRFRPWFFTIVHHKTVDVLRRSSYALPCSLTAPAAMTLVPGAADDPADLLDPDSLLVQLGPAHWEALKLTKIDGYSLAEAAERAGVSETAMKSRVARAIRAMAALLREEGVQ
jgi:RNA polymerase sigma-70 factor, ECF subfamily